MSIELNKCSETEPSFKERLDVTDFGDKVLI